MSKSKTIRDLERGAEATQKCEWLAERLSWLLCGGILVTAILGLLGPGWLSSFKKTSLDGVLEVSGYFINRNEAPTELIIQIDKATDEETVALELSRTFLDVIEIVDITPVPDSMKLGGQEIIYSFSSTGEASKKTVLLRYKSQSWGWLSFSCKYHNSSIGQAIFVLP
jgi:hypothetical protein